MYVCIYVCMYDTHTHIYIYIYIYMYISIYIYIRIYIYICTWRVGTRAYILTNLTRHEVKLTSRKQLIS
jgi:hypothetical protein